MSKIPRTDVFYLGSFPPPYGGATKKNESLFQELSKYGKIDKIDFSLVKKKKLREIVRYAIALVSRNATFVVGVSGAKTRRMLTIFLSYANSKAMGRSVLIVMGGVASKQIAEDLTYRKAAAKYKKIFVETQGMVAELEKVGLDNVEVYPNARRRINAPQKDNHFRGGVMRCVFFAQVSHEKGYDVAVDAVEILAREGMDIACDFFGKIPENQAMLVKEKIESAPHCKYRGVFRGNEEEIVSLLSGYDLLLFPSRWYAEGVPGTLVEALIAGTPCVVPKKSYNADVITDGISGKVVDDLEPITFAKAIREMFNPALLDRLSCGAKSAAERFFMDVCAPHVARAVFC